MDKQELINIINYIINQGLEAIKDNTRENINAFIDYVAIFSRDQTEFDKLNIIVKSIGIEVDKNTAKTGLTYLLYKPIQTSAGLLKLVKIRLPDPTRPQRGAPDFKIPNYQEFKNKYLTKSGNFALMVRKEYEMIEIKGVDVLVYIPDNTLGERLKINR